MANDMRPEKRLHLLRLLCEGNSIRSTARLCNTNIRTFLKRFTRLSLGFSKKLDNLRAAVALHVFHYNFCRRHTTLRVTPAMAAKVTPRLWKLADLFGQSA